MGQFNHAECSLVMPDAYEGTVRKAHEPDKQWSVVQAATYFDTPPVIERVGDWAICTDGLYCLSTKYEITVARLEEDWHEHMSAKTWINESDFMKALDRARSLRAVGYIR